MIILITVFGSLVALVAIAWAVATIIKVKKINIPALMDKVVNGIGIGESLALSIAPFAPGLPIPTIVFIADKVKKAVVESEVVYKEAITLSAETPDQRKANATVLIESALKLEGIEVTPDIQKLESVAIDLMCRALPKTHVVAAVAA
jgi:hypothetical protein